MIINLNIVCIVKWRHASELERGRFPLSRRPQMDEGSRVFSGMKNKSRGPPRSPHILRIIYLNLRIPDPWDICSGFMFIHP